MLTVATPTGFTAARSYCQGMTDALTTGTVFAERYEITTMKTLSSALMTGTAIDRKTSGPVIIHLFCSNVSASARWREVFCDDVKRLKAVPDFGQPRVLDCEIKENVAALICESVAGEPLIKAGQVQTPSSVVAWSLDIASLLSQFHELNPPLYSRSSRYETLWAKPDEGATLVRFGVAEPPVGTSVTTGLSVFVAPEAFGNSARTMSPAADAYWLGATMLLALNGTPPPSSLERASRSTPLPRAAGIPDDMWRLLDSMVAFKPADRPSMDQVYRKLLVVRC
jgi:serine/threonine protein kinase